MANIRRIDGKRGESYKITVSQGRDASGKQIRRFMTWRPEPGMTRRQAEKAVQRAALEFEQQIEQGMRPDSRQTFASYAEYFLTVKAAEGIRETTLDHYRHLLDRLTPAIGHIPIRSIRPQHMNRLWRNLSEPGMSRRGRNATPTAAFVAAASRMKRQEIADAADTGRTTVNRVLSGGSVSHDMAARLSNAVGLKTELAFEFHGESASLNAASVRSYGAFLSSVFSLAVKEGLIAVNPVSRSALPKETRKEAPHYEPEDIARMFAALEEEPLQWKALIHFLLASGCRRGEACALRWSRIDFETGSVTVSASITPIAGRGNVEGPTKSGKARRVILPDEVLEMLKAHRDEQETLRLAIGDAWISAEDYVFTRRNGLPMSPAYVSIWIPRFAERHGLPPLHTHELRHTSASLLIGNGVDIVEVSRRMGHASASITMNVYAHALEKADRAAAAAIGNALYRDK